MPLQLGIRNLLGCIQEGFLEEAELEERLEKQLELQAKEWQELGEADLEGQGAETGPEDSVWGLKPRTMGSLCKVSQTQIHVSEQKCRNFQREDRW